MSMPVLRYTHSRYCSGNLSLPSAVYSGAEEPEDGEFWVNATTDISSTPVRNSNLLVMDSLYDVSPVAVPGVFTILCTYSDSPSLAPPCIPTLSGTPAYSRLRHSSGTVP